MKEERLKYDHWPTHHEEEEETLPLRLLYGRWLVDTLQGVFQLQLQTGVIHAQKKVASLTVQLPSRRVPREITISVLQWGWVTKIGEIKLNRGKK